MIKLKFIKQIDNNNLILKRLTTLFIFIYILVILPSFVEQLNVKKKYYNNTV